MMNTKDFGKELKRVRIERGLTQSEVAEGCNITLRTIQRIESGHVQPRNSTIRIISDFLEMKYFKRDYSFRNEISISSSKSKTNLLKISSVSLLIAFCIAWMYNYEKSESEKKNSVPLDTKNYDIIGNYGTPFKDWAIVQKGNLYGCIDKKDKLVVPIMYDAIGKSGELKEEWSVLKKGNFYGCMDKSGKIVLPVIYTAIGKFGDISDNWAIVRKGSKFGVITTRGELLVECKFDKLEVHANEAVLIGEEIVRRLKI